MTPTQFRQALTDLGLTEPSAARLMQCSIGAIAQWKAGKRRIPGPVCVLLGMLLEKSGRTENNR